MIVNVSTGGMSVRRQKTAFRADAEEVLNSLRTRVSALLSELGNFSRPSDVQRALRLDKTLGRKVFNLASTAEALGSGGVVPSRKSMGRFLEAAKERGINDETVEGVWNAYEVFEKLIETHAGNRLTFNLMVSGTSGGDDEWFAADGQHRRNAFRAMSHTMGLQAKTHLQLSVITETNDGKLFDWAMIVGFYGLRVLRPLPSVRIYGLTLSPGHGIDRVYREPLGLTGALEGHLLEAYSSKPLPPLSVLDGTNEFGKWRQVSLNEPEVGNVGTSNLVFGTVHRNVPAVGQPLNIISTLTKPVEVFLFDVLKKRGSGRPVKPTGKAMLGYNTKFGPEEHLMLKGRFDPQYLGTGSAALSTPEVPHYKDMIDTVAGKLDWDIDDFEAWRIRAEFPIHQSTIIMSWEDSSEV